MLLVALESIADVSFVPLADTVAKLDLRPRDTSVLWLDINSPVEDQCWAMFDALRAITLGPSRALSARRTRHLRPVN